MPSRIVARRSRYVAAMIRAPTWRLWLSLWETNASDGPHAFDCANRRMVSFGSRLCPRRVYLIEFGFFLELCRLTVGRSIPLWTSIVTAQVAAGVALRVQDYG